MHPPCPSAYYDLMSDDFDGDSGDNSDNEYGEGGIPPDLEADIEDKIQREVDDRVADIYADSRPRSGGCLLILALPALCLWLW